MVPLIEPMVNMTLAIPDPLSKKMKKHADVRWTAVARQAIEKRVRDLELMDKLTKNSKLTQKDVEEISESINRSVAKKLGLIK